MAGNIVVAWLLTLPAAAAIGAVAYGLTRIFGTGALGPVLVTLMALCPCRRRLRAARPAGRAGPGGSELTDRLATIVQSKDLMETVIASLIAGVGVTAVFSVAIWSGARFADLSRGGRPLAAGAAAALGVLALVTTLAAVVFGIVVMTQQVASVQFWYAEPAKRRDRDAARPAGGVRPAGGNAADAILTAITMGFLAGIAWTVFVLSRQNQLTLAALSDGRRAILYAALGLIALLIAGSDELFSSGGGTLALDPPARRLRRRHLADLDRGQHLLSWRTGRD